MSLNVSVSTTTAHVESTDADDSLDAKISAAIANYEALYESTLQSLQQMMQQLFASEGFGGTGDVGQSGAETGESAGSGMTAQGAAGALAAYMDQNGIPSLTPNQLYQIAYSPKEGTPADVSRAAKYMLENPDVLNRIETHDVAGADGIAGQCDFDWAAQGGLDDRSTIPVDADLETQSLDEGTGSTPMSAQEAAGALAAYMHQHGTGPLDPNALYQLAYRPSAGTPSDVSEAAKYMLSHPDTYKRVETHDVAGADGISGIGNLQWAAQGGLDEA